MATANDVGCARCPSCGDRGPAVRAPRIARAFVPLAWAVLIAAGMCSALLLPLNMVLIPCWLACASAVGPLARKLLDPKCGGCGEPRGSAARAAHVAGGPSGPSDEGAVKGRLVRKA